MLWFMAAYLPPLVHRPILCNKLISSNYQNCWLYSNVYGYFPKCFFSKRQRGNSPRVFTLSWNFPTCNFPSDNFPNLGLVAALGPLTYSSRSACPLADPSCSARSHCSLLRPNLTFGKLPLGKLDIWEVGTWKVLLWENTLGKISYNLERTSNTHSIAELSSSIFAVLKHRIHPRNTILSSYDSIVFWLSLYIYLGARAGADYIECDIQFTRDKGTMHYIWFELKYISVNY